MDGPEPLGLLLDQAQDKIALLNDEGRFTYVNGAAERILGFTPGDLVGENAFEYVHPDDREAVRRAFYDVIGRDAFVEDTAEYRHRTADGSWVWLASRMSNLTDDRLDGYVVSSRDVTGRVRAERERAETASNLREIATVAGDVLWMFDADWSELRFVNPAYEELYGTSTDALEDDPTTFLDAVHPEDVPAVEAAMERLSEGTPVDIEYRVNPGENYNRCVWIQAEPITEDGEVVRITGFTRDVTDRRRRECQLVVMDNLLRHNLRNDLNVILGRAEFLESDVPEPAEHTAVIRRVGEQLLETAEKERDIIDLITEKRDSERIELRGAIADCVGIVRDRHPNASIEVSTPDPVTVEGLPELRSAMIELLENAVRHADLDDPTVEIALRRTPAGAEIVVRDDHAPIPSVEAGVLTGDHDMTDVYHSSGLGLWLVHWSVDLSDGTIAVDSGPDGGNEITVTLSRTAD
ncbi:PAS domain S-box protein [Halorubrum rubrum]|uniref:histidine kinase n=1 Tax=Halorubrum rubrum TaxID=1126240 RepID=A0ABD5QXD8_9EURY|nr:PAS domain S-box protein [Halorubrum rubrum]